jgi:DNA replication protein DnaC
MSHPYNIKSDALSDADAIRLAERYPRLGVEVGPYDYCPTCNKTGSYRWRGKSHECDCFYQLQLHKHYLNAGIGVTYQWLDWDDWFGPYETLEKIQLYLTMPFVERGMGLFLWGSQGTGKTMLATLVLKELIKRGIRCYAVTMDQMVDEYTRGWGSDEEKRWFDRKVRYAEVLLLDDIGKEGSRGSLPERTFNNLLRDRVQGGRPTLITTNISPGELGAVYGSNSLRMLYESAMEIHFTGDDVSLTINKRNNDEMFAGEVRPIV